MGLFSIFTNVKTVIFPGCDSLKNPKSQENYEKILDKFNVIYEPAEEIKCCGLPLIEQGYETEGRKFMRAQFENFKISGVKKIITFCPKCFKAFQQDYAEVLPDWNIEVINIWEFLLKKLKSKPRLIKQKANETIGFNDNCYLGRYCGMYDSPREILKILGYEIKELQNSRENSICSGSCGNYNLLNPKIANQIAKEKLHEAKRSGIKKLVVMSSSECELLKQNSQDIEM
jgi:Fe-S oxidoreductase